MLINMDIIYITIITILGMGCFSGFSYLHRENLKLNTQKPRCKKDVSCIFNQLSDRGNELHNLATQLHYIGFEIEADELRAISEKLWEISKRRYN